MAALSYRAPENIAEIINCRYKREIHDMLGQEIRSLRAPAIDRKTMLTNGNPLKTPARIKLSRMTLWG